MWMRKRKRWWMGYLRDVGHRVGKSTRDTGDTTIARR